MAGPRPRRSFRSLATHLVAGVVGIAVGVSAIFVAGALAPPGPAPGTVVLDTVQVDYTYLNGTPQIFGTNQQELCSLCPLTLTAGTTTTIGTLLVQDFPAYNTTIFWFNATAPIPFEEWSCSYSGARPVSWPPTGCPFTTDWHEAPYMVETGAGIVSATYPLTLAVPNPAPNLPGGFDVQLVFAVEMIPTGPGG